MVKMNQSTLIIHIYEFIIFCRRRRPNQLKMCAYRRTTYFCFLFPSTAILIYVFLGLFRFGLVGLFSLVSDNETENKKKRKLWKYVVFEWADRDRMLSQWMNVYADTVIFAAAFVASSRAHTIQRVRCRERQSELELV